MRWNFRPSPPFPPSLSLIPTSPAIATAISVCLSLIFSSLKSPWFFVRVGIGIELLMGTLSTFCTDFFFQRCSHAEQEIREVRKRESCVSKWGAWSGEWPQTCEEEDERAGADAKRARRHSQLGAFLRPQPPSPLASWWVGGYCIC